VALVTGASRGIGRAIALIFADAGADVVVTARKLPALEETAGEIRAKGRKTLAMPSNIGHVEDTRNLVEKVKAEFGRIDILVNNAVTNPGVRPLLDIEERAWDVVMNVNLKGTFLLTQLVARIMKEQGGGKIINISSIGGLKATELAIYDVSKAGLIMLTEVMAKEWGQYNIRVNAIAPGLIKTRFSNVLWEGAASEEAVESQALGHIGLPEDIKGAALYLASDASSYVTGETIVVDGGRLLGAPSWPHGEAKWNA